MSPVLRIRKNMTYMWVLPPSVGGSSRLEFCDRALPQTFWLWMILQMPGGSCRTVDIYLPSKNSRIKSHSWNAYFLKITIIFSAKYTPPEVDSLLIECPCAFISNPCNLFLSGRKALELNRKVWEKKTFLFLLCMLFLYTWMPLSLFDSGGLLHTSTSY